MKMPSPKSLILALIATILILFGISAITSNSTDLNSNGGLRSTSDTAIHASDFR